MRGPAAEVGGGGAGSWVERFMRFNPPHYKGSSAPEDAEFWVQEIKQLFSLLECPDKERVVLATHVLQGATGDWWRLVRRTTLQGRDIREIT